jgi:hypothetical protein
MAAIRLEKYNESTEDQVKNYIRDFMIDYKMHCNLLDKNLKKEICNNGEAELNFFKDWPLERFIMYKHTNPLTKEDHLVYSSINFFRRDIATQQIGDTTIVSPLWALKEITCHIVHLLATNQINIWNDTGIRHHSNVKIAIRQNLFTPTKAYVLLSFDIRTPDPNSGWKPFKINFSFELMAISNKRKYVLSNVEKKLPTLAFRCSPVFAFQTFLPDGQSRIIAAPIRHRVYADKDIINYSVNDIHQKGYIQIVPDRMIVQILQHAMHTMNCDVCVSPEFAKKLETHKFKTTYYHETMQKSLLKWKIPPIRTIPQTPASNVSVNV